MHPDLYNPLILVKTLHVINTSTAILCIDDVQPIFAHKTPNFIPSIYVHAIVGPGSPIWPKQNNYVRTYEIRKIFGREKIGEFSKL